MQQDNSHMGTVERQQPPDDFARCLRDALMHLNDPARLSRHPLNGYLAPLLPSAADTPEALRALLLDAIEALEPPETQPTDGQNWRPYLALVYRYVDGYSVADVVRRLHVSPRQFRRELRMGLDALALRVWSHLQSAAPPAPPPHRQQQPDDTVLVEVKSLGVSLECLPLGEILDSIRPTAAFLARHHGVVIEMPATVARPTCVCDRTLTRQALISCLGAILAGASPDRAGALLRVSLATPSDAPVIAIAMEPALDGADLARLRADLAECEALLSAQAATVALHQSEGGACESVVIRFGSQRAVRALVRAMRVLVVDDNEGMQQLYERYLSGEEYLVSVAASAAAASHLLGDFTPDVVVLDVMMRGMDGWEFLQALRARPGLGTTPVVICSVLREPGLAHALGAQAYLKKPITAEQLRQALRDVLA